MSHTPASRAISRWSRIGLGVAGVAAAAITVQLAAAQAGVQDLSTSLVGLATGQGLTSSQGPSTQAAPDSAGSDDFTQVQPVAPAQPPSGRGRGTGDVFDGQSNATQPNATQPGATQPSTGQSSTGQSSGGQVMGGRSAPGASTRGS
ncbi:MAG: hypothetical protein ACK5MT_01070 [Actinomycetales bacterium]